MADKPAPDSLDPEDRKLVVLARGAMGRVGATQGAAVRDSDGRTYAGAPVNTRTLTLTALQVAVATALSSGAPGFETAVIVGGTAEDPGVATMREVTEDATVIITDTAGSPRSEEKQ